MNKLDSVILIDCAKYQLCICFYHCSHHAMFFIIWILYSMFVRQLFLFYCLFIKNGNNYNKFKII